MSTKVEGGLNAAAKGASAAQRRTEDQQIADLESKIREVEERMKRKVIKASPLHKEFERFKKQAARFVQACTDEDRADIANSVLGVLSVTEKQVNAID
jgi:molecular chaperone GrpE (heat shock protein)